MRYNRADLGSTIRAAGEAAITLGHSVQVVALAGGYRVQTCVDRKPSQGRYVVHPNGKVDLWTWTRQGVVFSETRQL